LQARNDFFSPGQLSLGAMPSLVGATMPEWSTARVWVERGPMSVQTFFEAKPLVALDCTSGCQFGDELTAGVEGRVQLGRVGPVQNSYVFGRAEVVTTKWSQGARMRFGFAGIF
jgi:hypothetical protein